MTIPALDRLAADFGAARFLAMFLVDARDTVMAASCVTGLLSISMMADRNARWLPSRSLSRLIPAESVKTPLASSYYAAFPGVI